MKSGCAPFFVLVAAFASASCVNADTNSTYTMLDERNSSLKEHFNQAKGVVRLIFIVDPTCSGCLRGMESMNKALLSTTSDPRLQTFVVHVPVMDPPPDANDIARSAKLLKNLQVRHYWNPSGSFGDAIATRAGLEKDGEPVFAWDVWMIFGPDAVWDEEPPPQPRVLMHQLWRLEGNKKYGRLDPELFARDVRQLLAQLPQKGMQ